MRLDGVTIRNFRSIKFIEIEFTQKCLILAGINESGKSNILKAIASLGDFQPSAHDVREPSPDEEPINASTIEFKFTLTRAEQQTVVAEVANRIRQKNADKLYPLCKSKDGRILDIASFVAQHASGVLEIDLLTNKRTGQFWSLTDGTLELVPGWKKPASQIFDIPDDNEPSLSDCDLVFAPDFPQLQEDKVEPATADDVSILVGTALASFIESNLPKTMLWQYKEANLLPSSVRMDAFAQNPDSCIPLKNMFSLAGVSDISSAIADAKAGSRNALMNLLSRVAQKTTEHFRSVWREYKGIQFELRPDGELIIPGVRERNLFDFAKRSDGFKRFVSFLLLVSANVKSGTLTNTVLLVDEPDISLHPSGARYLRDELIRISQSNTVVFSTHSIFMIDKERIDRHLIVTKANEETKIEIANDNNLFAEEVIYNALGHSVFATLRQKNIIFEGWRDKHLFATATKRLPSSHSSLRERFKEVGVCHAKGVKHIKSITPLIELANRECIIITDGDGPAREKQTEYAAERGYGKWKRYDELLPNVVENITGEDFIKPSAFLPILKKMNARMPALSILRDEDLGQPQAKLRTIDMWLTAGGLSAPQRKAEIAALKEMLFDTLKPSDIEPIYFDFLDALSNIL